jgi:glucose/mannose transport system permease protein
MKVKKDQIIAIALLLPSVLLIALFVYGFIGNTIYISFTDWGKGAALAEHPVKNWVGLQNYVNLFSGFLDARFRQDLVNAVFYSVFLLIGAVGGGLGIAILLDRSPIGEGFFRTVFLYPLSLSFIVTGTIWRWLLAPQGGVNILPTFVGLPKISFQWLSSRESVLQFNWQNLLHILCIILAIFLIYLGVRAFGQRTNTKGLWFLIPGILLGVAGMADIIATLAAAEGETGGFLPKLLFMEEPHGFNLATIGIILAAVWQYSGYTMALYLAGLQGIPGELTEASRLDGASEWQYYVHIAIPMLKPITISAVIILSHISLKMFDLIFAMTGPDNAAAGHPALSMYLTTFRANQFAKGASIAVVLFLLAALFIIPYLINSYKERIDT